MAGVGKVGRTGGGPQMDIALSVIGAKREGHEIFWHNGGTGGYRSFMGFDPKSRVGVVVLSNMSTAAGVDDIGMHLLDSSVPLAKPAPLKVHSETAIDPKIFDRYTGVYQFAPGVTLTVTREDSRFYAQLTSQPKLEIFAEGDKDFFLKVVDAQLTFETDRPGPTVAVILHHGGRDQKAPRAQQ